MEPAAASARRRHPRLALCALAIAAVVAGGCGDKPQVQASGSVGKDARAWAKAARPLEASLNRAVADNAALTRRWVGQWDRRGEFRGDFMQMRGRLHGLLLQARALPGGTPEIEATNAALIRFLQLSVAAYDDYIAGIDSGRFERVEAGDQKALRASRQFLKAQPLFDEIFGEPAGAAAELRKLTDGIFQAEIAEARGTSTNSDMVEAIERGDWKLARRRSVQTRRIFQGALRTVEGLETPKDPTLRRFLADTIRGYRLVVAGYADYNRGLPNRDLQALRAGDVKVRQGFKLVNKARERLVRATGQK
jgi:hypothetical protein